MHLVLFYVLLISNWLLIYDKSCSCSLNKNKTRYPKTRAAILHWFMNFKSLYKCVSEYRLCAAINNVRIYKIKTYFVINNLSFCLVFVLEFFVLFWFNIFCCFSNSFRQKLSTILVNVFLLLLLKVSQCRCSKLRFFYLLKHRPFALNPLNHTI